MASSSKLSLGMIFIYFCIPFEFIEKIFQAFINGSLHFILPGMSVRIFFFFFFVSIPPAKGYSFCGILELFFPTPRSFELYQALSVVHVVFVGVFKVIKRDFLPQKLCPLLSFHVIFCTFSPNKTILRKLRFPRWFTKVFSTMHQDFLDVIR